MSTLRDWTARECVRNAGATLLEASEKADAVHCGNLIAIAGQWMELARVIQGQAPETAAT